MIHGVSIGTIISKGTGIKSPDPSSGIIISAGMGTNTSGLAKMPLLQSNTMITSGIITWNEAVTKRHIT
jgi:hypothetical protein